MLRGYCTFASKQAVSITLFGPRPNNKVSNSLCERAQEKNSGDAVRRLGTIIQSIFVPSQEPAFAYGPVRVGTQGLFRLCLKTFVAPFLPARLDCPWVSEGLIYGQKENFSLRDRRGKPRVGKMDRVANQNAGFASYCPLGISAI